MISLINPSQALIAVAQSCKQQRVACNYTQQELSTRSGVALATLRKFERTGVISLEGFFKISVVLGILDKIVKSVEPSNEFSSIDEILKFNKRKPRKRARKK